jgi:hypothetical protein
MRHKWKEQRVEYSSYRDGFDGFTTFLKRCQCLFIDPGMERNHVLSTWSRRTTHWTLNRTLISRSSVPTSFRKSYHFQLTTIVLRACSLLVDWDPYHPRSKDEPTESNVISSSRISALSHQTFRKDRQFFYFLMSNLLQWYLMWKT